MNQTDERQPGADIPPPTDDELASAAGNGSIDAFSSLVRRYEDRLYTFLLQKLGNRQDAEDVAQATFVIVYRQLPRYQPRERFVGWLFTIAHRQAVSLHRSFFRRRRLHEEAEKQALLEAPDPAELAEENDESRCLWQKARRVLTESQHTALWLYYAEDMSVAEIGQVLRKSEGSVKVILHRARKALRIYLDADGDPQQATGAAPVPSTERNLLRSQIYQ